MYNFGILCKFNDIESSELWRRAFICTQMISWLKKCSNSTWLYGKQAFKDIIALRYGNPDYCTVWWISLLQGVALNLWKMYALCSSYKNMYGSLLLSHFSKNTYFLSNSTESLYNVSIHCFFWMNAWALVYSLSLISC